MSRKQIKVLNETGGLVPMSQYSGKEAVLMDTVSSEPRPLPWSAIKAQVKFLMGDVLTVVDASFPEGEQKRATKSLIKSKFSDRLNWLYELCGYPPEDEDISELETVL